MSIRLPYRKEIVVDGKTYVRGPLLPAGVTREEKCANHCAGAVLGKCCFGWDCLHVLSLYWVEKPVEGDGGEGGPRGMTVCPKCGKRRRANRMAPVRTGTARDAVEEWCPECLYSHAVTCECCGEACLPDLMGQVEGAGSWCPSCMESRSGTCGCCGRRAPSGSLAVVTVAGVAQQWCEGCRSTGSSVCSRCGGRVPTGESVGVDGARWCAACAAEHTAACPECGCRTAGRSDGGPALCRTCSARRASGIVLGYHGMRDTPLKFWGGDGKSRDVLFLGFELEAGGASQVQRDSAALALFNMDRNRSHFHLERDGSIPEYGFELVSAPHTLAEHARYGWEAAVKAMSGNGLLSHDCGGKCGLHVHVSRRFLTEGDMVRIDAFVLRNRVFWERVARRTQSDYAQYLNKPDAALGHSCAERYCAVNFRPADTVEFRLFRGTLRYATLMATLETVDALCRWSKTRETADILRNEGEVDGFVAWMSDPARAGVYRHAVEYVAQRRACEDANSGTTDAANPDV